MMGMMNTNPFAMGTIPAGAAQAKGQLSPQAVGQLSPQSAGQLSPQFAGQLSPGPMGMLRGMGVPQRPKQAQGPINPFRNDHESMKDPRTLYSNALLKGTGNPQGTMSGAVRDAGEKIGGALLAGVTRQQYNNKDKLPQEQLGGPLEGQDNALPHMFTPGMGQNTAGGGAAPWPLPPQAGGELLAPWAQRAMQQSALAGGFPTMGAMAMARGILGQ